MLRERQLIHDRMYFMGWPNLPKLLEFRLDSGEESHAVMVDQYMTHYLRYPIFVPIDSV